MDTVRCVIWVLSKSWYSSSSEFTVLSFMGAALAFLSPGAPDFCRSELGARQPPRGDADSTIIFYGYWLESIWSSAEFQLLLASSINLTSSVRNLYRWGFGLISMEKNFSANPVLPFVILLESTREVGKTLPDMTWATPLPIVLLPTNDSYGITFYRFPVEYSSSEIPL